jgi:AraC-like DNA-binding protein
MAQEDGLRRQPVSLQLLFQKNYADEPLRQLEYEILYIEKGSGEFFWGNYSENVKEGDILFINSYEEHYFRKERSGDAEGFYRFLFDVSALGPAEDPCRKFFEEIRLCRFLNFPAWLAQRFITASKLKSNDERRSLILRSLLMDVISYAVETDQYERFSQILLSERRSISAIDNAVQYIRESYRENLNLGQLLQLTNYSKSHFIRLFKESTGMNISEYINKYRIEKACLDLLYTNNNITEIATANGFNNIQYFSRKFKEYMKCTPKQYQKKRKKLTER